MGWVKSEAIDRLFNPRSVAVVGITDSPARVGYNLLESVLYGGFEGPVYPVHPRLSEAQGLKVYRSLDEIPGPVDVVVVGVNQVATVEVIKQCGRLGIPAAVCVAGGFKETGTPGTPLEEQLVRVARECGVILVGPNTLGLVNTAARFYANFYPMRLPQGRVSFVTQSGGMGLTLLYRAVDEGLGVQKWVGVGNRSTLEISDFVEYLARDENTGVIGIYLEGSEDARRLALTAARVAQVKPVVMYKVGRSGAVDRAALTHTGSAAGSYRLYRDVFQRQCGLFMVDSAVELVAACKALALVRRPTVSGVGVVTHTAGPAIALYDRLAALGVPVPPLQEETIRQVEGVLGENPPVLLQNPLDTVGLGFEAGVYGQVVEKVLADPGVGLVVAVYCLHKNWRFPSPELVAASQRIGKPVIAYFVSTREGCLADRKLLQEAGVPLYTSAEEAAVAAAALVHYGERKVGS